MPSEGRGYQITEYSYKHSRAEVRITWSRCPDTDFIASSFYTLFHHEMVVMPWHMSVSYLPND